MESSPFVCSALDKGSVFLGAWGGLPRGRVCSGQCGARGSGVAQPAPGWSVWWEPELGLGRGLTRQGHGWSLRSQEEGWQGNLAGMEISIPKPLLSKENSMHGQQGQTPEVCKRGVPGGPTEKRGTLGTNGKEGDLGGQRPAESQQSCCGIITGGRGREPP